MSFINWALQSPFAAATLSGFVFCGMYVLARVGLALTRELRDRWRASQKQATGKTFGEMAASVGWPSPSPAIQPYKTHEEFRKDVLNGDVPIDKILERAAVAGVPERPKVELIGAPKVQKVWVASTPKGKNWLLDQRYDYGFYREGWDIAVTQPQPKFKVGQWVRVTYRGDLKSDLFQVSMVNPSLKQMECEGMDYIRFAGHEDQFEPANPRAGEWWYFPVTGRYLPCGKNWAAHEYLWHEWHEDVAEHVAHGCMKPLNFGKGRDLTCA